MRHVGYFTHLNCMVHDMGHMHPESPLRLEAIETNLQAQGLLVDLIRYDVEPADIELVKRVHPLPYINMIQHIDGNASEDNLTPVNGNASMELGSLRASLLATGAGCQAIDKVMANNINRAFCAIRSPGHHAQKSLGSFCISNNIAVAAMHVIIQYGLDRVAIIDFDVHNGNGAMDVFKGDERVMVCLSFQHPRYPNRHYDIPGEHLILTPLNAGSSGSHFRTKVKHDFFDPLDSFKPQLILISAGFDAHTEDPLGDLNLVEDDYRWMTKMINNIANRHSESRIVSILEGRYNLNALDRSVCAHIEIMLYD